MMLAYAGATSNVAPITNGMSNIEINRIPRIFDNLVKFFSTLVQNPYTLAFSQNIDAFTPMKVRACSLMNLRTVTLVIVHVSG
jgi:hypothetical protein